MTKIKKVCKAFMLFILYLFLSLLVDTLFDEAFQSTNLIVSNVSKVLGNALILLIISLFFIPQLVDGFKKINKKDLKSSYKNWIIGLIIMYISNIIILFINKDIATNESYNRELLFKTPLYATLVMVIVAPIIEELIFRLSIKDIFKNKWAYASISGLIFGMMHLTTIKSPTELLYIIPYGALGFMFAKSVYETDNIWNSILPHITHNGAIIAILYVTHIIGA